MEAGKRGVGAKQKGRAERREREREREFTRLGAWAFFNNHVNYTSNFFTAIAQSQGTRTQYTHRTAIHNRKVHAHTLELSSTIYPID